MDSIANYVIGDVVLALMVVQPISQLRVTAAEFRDLKMSGVTSDTEAHVHKRAKTEGTSDVLVKPVLKKIFEQI